MILKVIVDEQILELNVPEAFMEQAEAFYARMDRDMDRGWRMGRQWLERPGLEDRCRIVGDKLLTALEGEDHHMGRLMAGYILSRLPGLDTLTLATDGELENTRFRWRADRAPAAREATPPPAYSPAILERAEREVTPVYQVGRHWRFAQLDAASGQWREVPFAPSQEAAEQLRAAAVRQRCQDLTGSR